MNKKRILRRMLVLMFMVFTVSTISDQTYAYWATNITPPIDSETTNVITIGAWSLYDDWQPGVTYYKGDIVYHNGQYYEATRTTTYEPGAGWFWWFFWKTVTI